MKSSFGSAARNSKCAFLLCFLFVGCTDKGFQSSTDFASSSMSVASANFSNGQLILTGTQLDEVKALDLSQNAVSFPLTITSKAKNLLIASLTSAATMKWDLPIRLVLQSANAATPVLLTVNLSGTELLNFSSTGIDDFAISKAMTLQSTGYVGLGTSAPDSRLTVSSNSATLRAPPTGTVGHFSNADGATTRLLLDSYGGGSNLSLRSSNGTATSPSAVSSGIGSLSFIGYGATNYSSSARVQVAAYASETWTDSAQGAYLTISTTLTGSATAAERMRIDPAGNVGIGVISPQATLDVNGTVKLLANSSQPTACASANNGTIALTSRSTLCICKGASTAWVASSDGTTACTW